MGGSDKLDDSGPDRYHYAEHRDYLFALWDALDLGDRVILVLHDWGLALGFDWGDQRRARVQGIAYMEAIVTPLEWADFPGRVATSLTDSFARGRADGTREECIRRDVLPGSVLRSLSPEEMAHYREPFADPGEGRRPTFRGRAISRSRVSRPRLSGCERLRVLARMQRRPEIVHQR